MELIMPRPSKKENQHTLNIFPDHHDILMSAPIGIFTSTPEGRYISANPALAGMYGYDTPEELIKSVTDITTQAYVNPEDRREFMRLMEEHGKVVDHECRFKHKDGTEFLASINARAVQGEDGQVVAYQGFTKDITERKKAEELNIKNAERARKQRNLIAQLSFDESFVNSSVDDALKILTTKLAATLQVDRVSVWLLSENNTKLERRMLYDSASGVHSQIGILNTADIPSYFEALLKDSQIDADDAQNDMRTKELTDNYFIPLRINSLLDSAIQQDGRLIGVLSAEHRGTIRNWHADEKSFLSAMTNLAAQLFANADRKRAEAEREKLQAQLNQAQKMESIGMLAGGIAHDFNNLLHAMGGNLQLLDMKIPEDHPGKNRIKTIQKAIDRAAQLVSQMLLFSRKAETSRMDMDLNQEIDDSIKMLKRSIPKMVKIEFFPDIDLQPIKADPIQVEQVLLNLGTNAADAMTHGGRLILETRNISLGKDNYMSLAPGQYVFMSVTDTGHGMSRETRERVFDPFFTTKEVGKGTGLGLASVYGIVKSHMGHVTCYSEFGKGTTFKIYWPASISDKDPEVMKSNVETALEHKKETILVVDDDDEIRELTADVLKSYDYQVLAANSGEQALEVYAGEKESIDLVLLDLNMPGMGGHQCLVELVKISPGIRVLITSGYSFNGQVKETLEQGAVGFIGKPFQVPELLAKVRQVLDNQERQGGKP
jgi:PAS domain S-box-containing protein